MHQLYPIDKPMAALLTIVNSGRCERIAAKCAEEGARLNFSVICRGTAHSRLRHYLGLDDNERELVFSLLPMDTARTVLRRLNEEEKLASPGHGVAFILPMSDVCPIPHKYFTEEAHHTNRPQTEGETIMEQGMQQAAPHELIIAIANRGYSDPVMDAAREAGAMGGTVIHARGTGLQEAEKFFGITIQPEKELILILTTADKRCTIINSIVDKTGQQTDAKALVFSVPVTDVAGLASVVPVKD